MIYTGLSRTGEIESVKAHGGGDIAEVYGGIGETNPIYYKSRTITGTLPLSYKALGKPLSDYLIEGNTLQNGTPTPSDPVDVVGCGERTENVMPAGEQKTVEVDGVTFSSDGKGKYTIIGTATAYTKARFNLLSAFKTPISVSNGGQGTLSFFNTQSNNNVTFVFYNGTIMVDYWKQMPIIRTNTAYNVLGNKYVDDVVITVNSGATVDMTITPELTNNGVLPSSFEPYGYKLPLTVNGTEYPIYLGEVPTTRRIKKLVLTGEEPSWNRTSAAGHTRVFLSNVEGCLSLSPAICTHYIYNARLVSYPQIGNFVINSTKAIIFGIDGSDFADVEAWKTWLASQYAAGTPVTIWYVLAEPETGIVNEPLHKIGDYADTISFAQAGMTILTASGANVLDTTSIVKPSEVHIRGNIKPTGYGKLTDKNGVYILDKDGVQLKVHGQ